MDLSEQKLLEPDYWFRIIADLERVLSLREIAEKVGSNPAALYRFKAGEYEPRWKVALRLIILHRLKCSTGETRPTAELARSL